MRVVLHPLARKAYKQAPDNQRRRLVWWQEQIESGQRSGQRVTNALIPRRLRKLAVTNLWRLELMHGWRAMYTVATTEGRQAAIILFIGDHDAYSRLMGYKK